MPKIEKKVRKIPQFGVLLILFSLFLGCENVKTLSETTGARQSSMDNRFVCPISTEDGGFWIGFGVAGSVICLICGTILGSRALEESKKQGNTWRHDPKWDQKTEKPHHEP